MKTKQYEKQFGSMLFFFVIWIIEVAAIIVLWNTKINKYKSFSAVVVDKNQIVVYTTSKEKKIMIQNANLYWNNKKIKYDVMKNNKETIELKCSLPKTAKTNDVITITIKEKRINMIDVIIQVWGGDKNN